MSHAEFEEKEFEGPLNGQLGLGGPMWSPGQVLEHLVGFDVAILTEDAVFWAARGFATPPPGAPVLPRWWPSAFTRLATRIRRPPSFRMNVFLQHKRPEHLSRSSAVEWPFWGTAYFRFSITPHQQVALEACAAALGQNGLVAYASPAFAKRDDLFKHVERRTLVRNTHFAPAASLAGHGRYTYVDAATPGVAHSEPVRVEPLTILNGGSRDRPPEDPPTGGDGRAPREILREARRAAQAAVDASPYLVGNNDIFATAVERARVILRGLDFDLDPELGGALDDFLLTAMFASMSGIRWHVLPANVNDRRVAT